MNGVWSNGMTIGLHPIGRGFDSLYANCGTEAQVDEQLPCKQKVAGSNPVSAFLCGYDVMVASLPSKQIVGVQLSLSAF